MRVDVNPYSDVCWRDQVEVEKAKPTDFNPFSDICWQVQAEFTWARNRNLKGWPHCFRSRDGWAEWRTYEGAW